MGILEIVKSEFSLEVLKHALPLIQNVEAKLRNPNQLHIRITELGTLASITLQTFIPKPA